MQTSFIQLKWLRGFPKQLRQLHGDNSSTKETLCGTYFNVKKFILKCTNLVVLTENYFNFCTKLCCCSEPYSETVHRESFAQTQGLCPGSRITNLSCTSTSDLQKAIIWASCSSAISQPAAPILYKAVLRNKRNKILKHYWQTAIYTTICQQCYLEI